MPTISAFPNWVSNPYLNLLYLESRARGWQIKGGKTFESLLEDLPSLESGDVFHIHWTTPFTEAAGSADEFDALVETFIDLMNDRKASGVKLFWTVHNVVAHDATYPQSEIRLARTLADLADRIIILNGQTNSVTGRYYDLPTEKLYHLPHPSYLGVYSGSISRQDARAALGIDETIPILGMAGAFRPYKGAEDFLDAVALLRDRGTETAVLMAGKADEFMREIISERIPDDTRAYRRHDYVPNEEMALWVAACDVIALPFRNILNSGSLLLAASYGVPVVLPRHDHLVAEYGEPRWISYFYPTDDVPTRIESIADAIQSQLALGDSTRQEELDFARLNTPFDMTMSYANLLEEVTG